jgi:hypothetical protein
MAITLDNSIIDFNTINNIVTSLQTHEDLFTAFENQALVTASTISSDGVISTNSLNVGSVTFAAVRATITPGTAQTINYGVTFVAAPTVVATVEGTSSTSYIAQIETTQGTTGSTTFGSATLHVNDTSNGTSKTPVTVHVLAVGQV